MNFHQSHLRPDGTIWPPVTPDPPPPPGYVSPVPDLEGESLDAGTPDAGAPDPDEPGEGPPVAVE